MDSRNATEFQEDILGLKQEPAGSLLPFMTDKTLAVVSPLIIYWVHSLLYHIIDTLELPFFEKYRLHTPLEVRTRNRVDMFTVIYTVLAQQAVQTIIGIIWLRFEGPDYVLNHAAEMTLVSKRFSPLLDLLHAGSNRGEVVSALYWYIIPAFQFLVAILVMDSWQYWMHRFFHMNRFLYRHIHSRHHRLYVPYAFGALYNHPIEGLVMDTCGAGAAMSVARLTTRQTIVLFTFATLKTVDDHCGYKLPFNPLQRLFPNNAAYHDIHHQAFGIKKNFSQPFFTFWDKIMGSYLGVDEVPQKFRVKRDGKGAIIQPVDETGHDDGSAYSLDSNSDENEKKSNCHANGKANGNATTNGTPASGRNLRSRRKQA